MPNDRFKNGADGVRRGHAVAMGRSNICTAVITVALLLFGFVTNARAVPAFVRQTGQQCIACHVSFPELTPYGRYFKITSYTIGTRQTVPLSLMAQASVTKTQNNTGVVGQDGAGNNIFGDVNPRDGSVAFSGASLFLAGKATDHFGGFVQWTYNNLATDPDTGDLKGHSGIDNTDLRLTRISYGADAKQPDWIYGLTLNNNPTVQDVWNSTPAFGFPYTLSPLAQTPATRTLIDGGLAQQVAGIGVYAFWLKTVYAELSLYRTADGMFSWLRAGQYIDTPQGVNRLSGYNPYWRLALDHEWGPHSIMVGTYGMVVDKLPETPTDRFTDIAADAQYQYITHPHTVTAQATYIHERQDWNASFPNTLNGNPLGLSAAAATPVNPSTSLDTVKIKGSYYYQRKYGVTLAYFSTTGSTDAGLYPVTGVPDSKAYVAELDYLPIQNVRLMLQYTYYTKFNGAGENYDGTGRNAWDNNTLFFNVWLAF
jgi:hypothetical protein